MAAFSLAFSTLALAPGTVCASGDSSHGLKGLSEAARLASASFLGAGQMESFSGRFHIIYGDAPAGSGLPSTSGYVLVDDQDQAIELLFGDQSLRALGGARAINHRRVTVTGQAAVVPLAGVQTVLPLMAVQALQHDGLKSTAAAAAASLAVSGPQAWATILCRFADSAGATPHPIEWFNTLMLGTTAPGLEHYWRELSFDNVNLIGSAVHGWYTLPQPRSYYVYGSPAQLDHQRAANDCTAVADADVYFPDFVGINLMFNGDLDGYAWGGSWTLTRDGMPKNYRMTWLPPWGYENQGPVGHEMGHGFGLPHSSGPYSATYDSRWDVMSDIWGNCPPYDPTYRCVGPHTISYHKDILGWIPSAQKYVAVPGTSQTITMERLGQPTSGTSYLMAQIPIGGSTTQFYTVEVRRFAGYDAKLPGEAVVIHRVDATRSDRDAQVVDPDVNGNPDDAGAMWVTAETFVDPANGITVSVISSDATSSQVSIQVGGPSQPDLVITSLSNPSATVVAGGSFTVTDTTANSGMATAGGSTTRYRLSTDATITGSDRLLTGSRSVLSMAAGASNSGSRSVTVPTSVPVGTYFLGACADDLSAVTESNEANNCRASTTTVQVQALAAQPDLVVSALSFSSSSVRRGRSFTVTDTTANSGMATAGGSTTRYRLSTDATITGSDRLLTGSRSVLSMAAGASNSGSRSVTVPTSVPVGTYFLGACADDLSAVTESNEANNCRASTTTISVR
jgi:M6 family metalloprotease-like protein